MLAGLCSFTVMLPKKKKGQSVFPLPNTGCFEGDVMLKEKFLQHSRAIV